MRAIAILGILAAAGSVGCASTRTIGQAWRGTPLVPGGNDAAQTSAATTSCRVTGDTRVIATHALANELQVNARPGGGYQVVVVDGVEPCLMVDLARDASLLGGPVLGKCPEASRPGRAIATNGTETYLAHETSDDAGQRHLAIGVVTYDWPHASFGVALAGRKTVVEHPLPATAEGAGAEQTDPKLSPAIRDSFLLVWVEGDHVHAQPLFRWAEPAGPQLVVSPLAATEVEHPAVAFAPPNADGREGLVVYAARVLSGFHVLATPVACTSTAGMKRGRG